MLDFDKIIKLILFAIFTNTLEGKVKIKLLR